MKTIVTNEERIRDRPWRTTLLIATVLILAMTIVGCGSASRETASGSIMVVATTSFLRDIAQNVAGDRFTVGELIPIGVDPHEWQPAPGDLVAAAKSDLVIVNGGGLEGTLLKDLQNAGGHAEAASRPRDAHRQAR